MSEHGHETRNVGLLLRPPESLPGFVDGTSSFSSLAGAVLVALLGAGYSVTSFESLDRIGEQVGRLNAFVLLHPNRGDEVLSALVRRGIPTVSCDSDPGNGAFQWWVGPNYGASTLRMLEHLIGAGASRPALIIGTTRNTYNAAIARVYMSEMRARGWPVLLREVDPVSGKQGGSAAMLSLLSTSSPPDAVIASSGLFAVGAVDAVLASKRRVPDDVLVASMMDGPVLEHHSVPVTSMRPNFTDTAQRVTGLLEMRLSDGAPPPRDTSLELELVVRTSTLRRQ